MTRPFIEQAREFWESDEGRRASQQIDAEVQRASDQYLEIPLFLRRHLSDDEKRKLEEISCYPHP